MGGGGGGNNLTVKRTARALETSKFQSETPVIRTETWTRDFEIPNQIP